MTNQQRLPGGGLGGASQVGGAVRRNAGPWTPTIHKLLTYLNSAGIEGVPEPLSYDDGYELISLIPGQTVYTTRHPDEDGWPDWAYTDDLLVQAGQWLARYHEAVRDFRPTAPHWRSTARPLGPDEIVCHYDFRAANIIVDGIDPSTGQGTPRLISVVDWDTAGPGRPLFDLALTAWNWIPLWQVDKRATTEIARRLHLLAAAYGHFTPHEIVAAVPDRLDAATETTRAMAAAGDQAMARLLNPNSPPTVPGDAMRRRLPDILEHL